MFLWSNGRFRLDHTFDTERATDIIFLPLGPYLIITSNTTGVAVLVRTGNGNFVSNSTLSSQAAVKVERLGDAEGNFVVAFSAYPAQMFVIDASAPTTNAIMVYNKVLVLMHNLFHGTKTPQCFCLVAFTEMLFFFFAVNNSPPPPPACFAVNYW